MTWFDRFVFDREWYRLLKPRHPRSFVPYTLPLNIYLMTFVSVVIGVVIGGLT